MIKKLTLGSVVAAACLFTSMNAQSLEEAFANGKFKGEIRSYYFEEDYDTTGKSSLLHMGGFLNYKTADFYGLSAGATFQVSSATSLDGVNKFASSEDASGSVLSESFLEYTRSNSTLKVGRQFIGTPLLAGSGSRMIRQSFQGVTFTNTDISNTKVVAAYVDRFQTRTDGAGSPGTFTKNFDTNANLGSTTLEDGAYTIYVKNNSVDNLTLEAQYLDAVDAFSSTYLNGEYDLGTDLNLYTVGQYIGTSYDTTDKSGSIVGLRVGGKLNNLNFKVSVSENSSDGDVQSGLGYGADYSLTASSIDGGYWSYLADTKAYQVALGTTIAKVGVDLSYSSYDLKTGSDITETDISASYDIMKNLNINVLHAIFDGKTDMNSESRVKLTYKF